MPVPMSKLHGLDAMPLLGLVLSLVLLVSRFYTSASYERPLHLVVLTLTITAASLNFFSRSHHIENNHGYESLKLFRLPSFSSSSSSSSCSSFSLDHHLESDSTHTSSGSGIGRLARILHSSADRLARVRASFWQLLGCIVLRSFLFWAVIRETQCSRLGVEAFLPFMGIVCTELLPYFSLSKRREIELGYHASSRRRSGSSVAYGLTALLWAFTVISTLSQARTRTGAICPSGWQWEPFTVAAQICGCFLDATALTIISDLPHEDPGRCGLTSRQISRACYAAAVSIFLIAFPTLLVDGKLYWTFYPHLSDVRDLAIDSLLSAIALLSIYHLLPLLHPASVALLTSSLVSFGYHIPGVRTELLLPPLSSDALATGLAALPVLTIILGYFTLPPVASSQTVAICHSHRWTGTTLVLLSVVGFAWTTCSSYTRTFLPFGQAVERLMSVADAEADRWAAQAGKSQTLQEAVAEYSRRYSYYPPPNFDKWYNFAKEHHSAIIDDFDQIHEDTLPFWGMEPAAIREKTNHLLGHSSLEMGGIRIRNGVIEQSPHVPGSHRWMMDSLEHMIEPFAKWLPDLDLPINLADECRMALPFEAMQGYKAKARAIRAGSMQRTRVGTNITRISTTKPWLESFQEPQPANVASPHFSNNIRWQLYYDLIAPSCPPDSPARRGRWWDRSTVCVDCLEPHSIITDKGALPSDSTSSHDLCHQYDLAYLDGFIMSPSAMIGTNDLFPIFSQARVGGFSDILFPSPWNFDKKVAYEEETDVKWENKTDGLFWRGSSSDGYAAHGSWTGFLRARFVHEAYEERMSTKNDEDGPVVNVSFAGGISRCHEADCDAEQQSFLSWAKDTQDKAKAGNVPNLASQATPFEDHWHYKHLIDMDGAGFSGRFLPFLKSKSLVYRAALFRAWFDERLTPWHHYVPVDVRLGRGFWALLEYFSGKKSDSTTYSAGVERAKNIAERGREWAHRTLRPEDMQVYMFRLLLEWGRIVDDDRENSHYGVR